MPLFRYAATILLLVYGMQAHAALDDPCTAAGGVPGTEDAGGACLAVPSPGYGTSCGATSFFDGTSCAALPAANSACSVNGSISETTFSNGSACVVNNTSSGSCAAPSRWVEGTCVAPPAPPAPPSVPTAPTGSLGDAAAALGQIVAPGANGGQEPICINSSPVVGAAPFFVVIGSTLCYGTASGGSGTDIYAYKTTSGGLGSSWNGLRAQDFFAGGSLTALGQLNIFGGAQMYSPDGNSGIVVANGNVLSASSSGANSASQLITPMRITSSVTDGSRTTSQTISAGQASIVSSNGAASTGLVIDANQASVVSANGSNSGTLTVSASQAAVRTSNGSATTSLVIDADQADMRSVNGSNSGVLSLSDTQTVVGNSNGSATTSLVMEANQADMRSVNGGNSGVLSLSDTQTAVRNSNGTETTQLVMEANQANMLSANGSNSGSLNLSDTDATVRVSNGASRTQSTATANSYVIEAASSIATSRVSIDSSTISLMSGYGGTLASNGTTGTTSGIGSGAIQVHQSAQAIANNTTIGNLLAGNTYQNKVNGNLFVDGNVYINGTLEYVSSNAATTTVTSTAGSSILGATLSTKGGTSTVMKGTDATHAKVDKNGKIELTPGVSAQSSSAMTLTNGLGNTHGFIVNETQATMSGGINSSSMTLNDNGATFSNSATGMPIQVHGVADGTADFDAVNVRQLRRTREELSAGIAGISAMANIPHVDPGKTFSMGAGVGHYQNATSLAIGSSYRVAPNTVIRASIAGTDSGSSMTTTYGLGVGVSW